MIRRTFLSRTGKSVAPGILAATLRSSYAASNPAEPLTTTEQRYYYLKRLLKELCTDLGPRPAGSESFGKGIRIIKWEMEACPRSELDEYTYEKWELIGDPLFRVGNKHLDACPFHGCSGTPREGFTGVLKKPESGGWSYVIVDRTTGITGAYVSVSSYGPAIPRSAYRYKEKALPIFGVGKYDVPVLDEAVRAETPVHVRANTRFVPDFPSWNAVAAVPGETSDEVLFLAHADTVYTSPGANDNTASVIVMLMLARAFADMRPKCTLRFVAAGNEEYGTFGAEHYAGRRIADGTMKNIKYIVQFDSLTYGPNLLLTSEDAELRSLVQSINDNLETGGTPRHIESDAYVMDAAPFRPSGARAIYINSRGYDGITLPVYHRPEDVPETVGFDCVENSYRVFKEFISRVQKL